MNFNIISKNKTLIGQPTYCIKENSFSYEPWENTDFSIMIGKAYNSLDVSLNTQEILHLSGCNPKENWIEQKLEIPQSNQGVLNVVFENAQVSGTGEYYIENWLTYYDKQTGWICIGDTESFGADSVEFAKVSWVEKVIPPKKCYHMN